MITSKSNQLIKTVAKLISDRKFRYECGLYVVEGVKPVRECLRAGCTVDKVICTEEHLTEFPEAVTVSPEVFKHISTEVTPQGVLALVKIPDISINPPKARCLLLDRLQDPGNLGTIIRTANAAGYSEIYLINCTDAYSPKAVRASMSGIFHVKIYSGTQNEILDALSGVPIICADMDGEDIFEFVPPEKFCLCIGNEGGGISADLMGKATKTIKIPMADSCESLNAGVSAGIAMYQLKNYKR